MNPADQSTDPPALVRSTSRALVDFGNLYRRLLSLAFGIAGPRAAYGFMENMGLLLYSLLDPLRELSEGQCQAALGERLGNEATRRIARRAFVHRAWNLADLLMADRLLRPNTFEHYGGRIPEDSRRQLLDARRRKQPVILLTAYYGPYDLLPLFLGFNDIPAYAVYRRHPNEGFDALRQQVRTRSGCHAVATEDAVAQLPDLLERGETVAILADHHGGERDLPVTFLGLPTRAIRSVPLLACRYDAVVVVAGIRRSRRRYGFELEVGDMILPADWSGHPDPPALLTDRYLRSLERIILKDPAQYLWGHARWGAEVAGRFVGQQRPTSAD